MTKSIQCKCGEWFMSRKAHTYHKQVKVDKVNHSRRPEHKERTPGTVRPSRMEGGSGFRNNWED